jgi:hypothetical protein
MRGGFKFLMRMRMRFSQVAVGTILLAAATLMSAGCGGDNSNNANSPARQQGGQSSIPATPTQNTTAQATPAQATPVQATPAPVGGGVDSLPIADAAAFRDRLLEIAKTARPESQAAWADAEAIRNAWQKQYPNLKFAVFYSMPADPNTVSASDAFLISGVSGNFDQLYSFAVADTKGKCAGGVAVIPGDSANRRVSEEKAPTVFKPVDMPDAKSCTGDDAGKNYKP